MSASTWPIEIGGRQVLADRFRIVIDRGRQERRGLADEFGQSPHAWQHQPQHALQPLPPALGVDTRRPQSGRLQQRLHTRDEIVRIQPREVLRVEPVELLGIEDGGAPADAVERKRRNQLVARHHLAIAPGDHPSSARKFTIASGRYPMRSYSVTDVMPCRLLSFFLSVPRINGTCANSGGVRPSA